MNSTFTESIVEDAALARSARLYHPAWSRYYRRGTCRRTKYRAVTLEGRLQQALVRLNPDLPRAPDEVR